MVASVAIAGYVTEDDVITGREENGNKIVQYNAEIMHNGYTLTLTPIEGVESMTWFGTNCTEVIAGNNYM